MRILHTHNIVLYTRIVCIFAYLDLSLDQAFEKVKAVAITLKRPYLPCRSVFPPQLLSQQKAPISCDALDTSSHPTFSFKGDDLIGMKPVLVVHLFERLVEACLTELVIERREGG